MMHMNAHSFVMMAETMFLSISSAKRRGIMAVLHITYYDV